MCVAGEKAVAAGSELLKLAGPFKRAFGQSGA